MPKKATGEFTIDPTAGDDRIPVTENNVIDGTAMTAYFDFVSVLSSIEAQIGSLDSTEWELLTQFCAKTLLAQVAKLDPRWERLIEAAKVETGMDEWKWLGSQLARVLENGQHLNVARHPYFEVGGGRVTEKQCEWPECRKMFFPSIPGQRFHDDICGTKAFNSEREKKRMEDEETERARKENQANGSKRSAQSVVQARP